MANREAQTGFVLRNYSSDQVFGLESIDSAVFDRILEAVNKGDKQTTLSVFNTILEKRDAGYILTPMTEELYRLAQVKLGRSAHRIKQ